MIGRQETFVLVGAIHTFTSGKRNDLENLGIIQLKRSGPLRTHDWRGDTRGSAVAVPYLVLHAAEYQLFYRTSFSRGFALELLVEGIRDVYRCSHSAMLPCLWLAVKRPLNRSQPPFAGRSGISLIALLPRAGHCRGHRQRPVEFECEFGACHQRG